VPHLPGTFDGVGDYAVQLAQALRHDHGVTTTFLVAEKTDASSVAGFSLVSDLRRDDREIFSNVLFDGVILHYVNYGYQPRGVPLRLRNFANHLRKSFKGSWITMFHELYAWGAPWKSAFWLQPLQVRIARDIAHLSDVCFVSNEVGRNEIRRHAPAKRIRLIPIMSNFGEPRLERFDRNPKTWAICGGASLIARSLQSFIDARRQIPKQFFPAQLEVIGGRADAGIREKVQRIAEVIPGLKCSYHPEIKAEQASSLLTQCSFGWIDYFRNGKPWSGMILKSGSFAAFCANGVIPVSTHEEPGPAVDGDRFPGLCFVTPQKSHFPPPEQISEIRQSIYSWYHRHASSTQTATAYAQALAIG
jgi:hypothetical protein